MLVKSDTNANRPSGSERENSPIVRIHISIQSGPSGNRILGRVQSASTTSIQRVMSTPVESDRFNALPLCGRFMVRASSFIPLLRLAQFILQHIAAQHTAALCLCKTNSIHKSTKQRGNPGQPQPKWVHGHSECMRALRS